MCHSQQLKTVKPTRKDMRLVPTLRGEEVASSLPVLDDGGDTVNVDKELVEDYP